MLNEQCDPRFWALQIDQVHKSCSDSITNRMAQDVQE